MYVHKYKLFFLYTGNHVHICVYIYSIACPRAPVCIFLVSVSTAILDAYYLTNTPSVQQ